MDKLDAAIIDCEASSRLTAPAYLAWQRIKEAAKQTPPAALAVPAVDKARFESAPCYLCGYNGPGYYQPSQHPCAAGYHAQQPAALAVPEEVRRNAERYAFLRGDVRPGSVRWARWEVKHWTGWWNPVQGEEMDAAIDAARGKE